MSNGEYVATSFKNFKWGGTIYTLLDATKQNFDHEIILLFYSWNEENYVSESWIKWPQNGNQPQHPNVSTMLFAKKLHLQFEVFNLSSERMKKMKVPQIICT